MKYLVAVVLILAGVLGAAPYLTGQRIEQGAAAQMQMLDDIHGYQISLQNYQRGYASSSATLQIRPEWEALGLAGDMTDLRDQLPESMLNGLELDLEIGHGPFLHQRGMALGMAEIGLQIDDEDVPLLSSLMSQADIDYIFDSYTRLGFDGSGTTETHMPAVSNAFPTPAGPLFVDFTGSNGSYSLQDFGARGQGETEISRIQIGLGEFDLGLSRILFDSQWQLNDRLFLSDQEAAFSVDEITYELPEATVRGEDLSWTMSHLAGESPESRTLHQELSLDLLRTLEWELTDAHFAISLENISEDFLLAYYDLSAALARQGGEDPDASLAMRESAANLLLPTLPDLLQKNPSIRIDDLSFNWNDQILESSLSLNVDSSQMDLQPSLPLPMLLSQLRDALEIDLFMEAEKSLVENILTLQMTSTMQGGNNELPAEELAARANQQAQSILRNLVNSGYLLESPQRYVANLTLRNGRLDINGVSLPLPF